MKRVIASLFVFVMMFSFVLAGSSSSVRSDFYIQDEGSEGGYEEEAVGTVGTADMGSSRDWLLKIVYWAAIVVIILILIRLLRKVSASARRTSVEAGSYRPASSKSRSSRKKTKTKRSRRKK